MARLSKTLKTIEVDNRMDELRSYFFDHPEVAAAFLFGSYGTVYQNPLSDLDIAILLKPESDMSTAAFLGISCDVTGILGEEDVNVVILNTVPITLQHEILSTGRLLCKKGFYLEDFHEYVCKRYADFKIDLDAFNVEYDEALKELYCRGK